ncbi:MAG TPA: acyl-CoA thioesterase II [Phycicoccus sp.]|nr:acyl-CoA thioesterase II [Phycicoccus sp.]
MSDARPTPIANLLATLDLEEVGAVEVSLRPRRPQGQEGPSDLPSLFNEDVTVFLGQSQKMPHGRVFGGQVLAQCVMAAGRTVGAEGDATTRPIHSLHAYFMRPGDDTAPIHFTVERMRDGASFSTRRVHAIQHGATILAASASFQAPAGGLDHQEPMPAVPAPEELPSLTEVVDRYADPTAGAIARRRPVDLRHVDGALFYSVPEQSARQSVWMRTIGALPDDPLIQAATLAYCSDYTLLEPILRRHSLPWSDRRLRMASLDHAMWFHRPGRVDDWVLYDQCTPSARSGRGLGVGKMFTRDGTLIATVAQEGMVRVKGL